MREKYSHLLDIEELEKNINKGFVARLQVNYFNL